MSVRDLLTQIETNGEAIGSYTFKMDCRKTGFSLHVKFENPVDIEQSLMAAQIMGEGPQRLVAALYRLAEAEVPS